MKHAIHLSTLVVIAGLLLFASCMKETIQPNNITNPTIASAMLQGAWVYKGGQETWHFSHPDMTDTTVINPEYPMVRDLRFMANGTAYIEFNTYNQWQMQDALQYEEREFLWAISESGNTLMLTDVGWERSKWQILSLTDTTLSVSFNLTGGTIPSGMEINCTYAYRHK